MPGAGAHEMTGKAGLGLRLGVPGHQVSKSSAARLVSKALVLAMFKKACLLKFAAETTPNFSG